MDFAPVAAMALLIVAIINFVKYVRARDVNGVVTQLAVWAAGLIVIFLAAETDWAATIMISGLTLDQLNTASRILLGLTVSSIAMFANDIRAAIDTSDSSHKPSLVPSGETT